ncbi:MAG TPA: hypothetical protein VKB80_35970 [Kofleriaceae bacterium]|nr:hypothetical protein [Kofleriaceae bacterium]
MTEAPDLEVPVVKPPEVKAPATLPADETLLVGRGRSFRAAAVVTDLGCGGTSVALGVLHLQAVLTRALAGEGIDGAKHFAYDFHFASLLIIGALLVIPGAVCLFRAIGLARRRRGAWASAMRATLILVGVNGVLIPVQAYAILLGALAGLNLVVLLLSRRHYPAETRRL